jgi:hypothetical protein
MCVFSRPIKDVSTTKIFGRMTARGRQGLAYQMQLDADEDVAMILPIPVPPGSSDDAVHFVSLEGYVDLFGDLFRAFHPPAQSAGRDRSHAAMQSAPLKVHTVGAFVASFVPSLAAFARLDPRFRLPHGTLDQMPAYADYGFAVFQLGATHGAAEIHPMSFEFPTRVPTHLFFPTVHVHDGEMHEYAEFSHAIYAQGIDRERRFQTLSGPARDDVNIEAARGLVDAEQRLSMWKLVGIEKNQDQWVTVRDAR